MRAKILIPTAFLFSACATLPVITEKNYAMVEDILATVECELREAVIEVSDDKQVGPIVDLEKLAATAELSLDVIETDTGDGSISLVVPFSNATFTLGLEGGLARKNTRKTTIKNQYNFSDLECVAPRKGESKTQAPFDQPLTNVLGRSVRQPKRLVGKIGLRDWLRQAVYSAAVVDRFPQDLTYVVAFDLVGNAKISPEISDTFSTGEIITGKAGLKREKQRTHTVTVVVVSADGDRNVIRDVAQRDAVQTRRGPLRRDRVDSNLSKRLDEALNRSILRSLDVD